MKIEFTFENSLYTSDKGYDYYIEEDNVKKGQYIGLCAVLKLMATMVEEDIQEDNSLLRLETIAKDKYAVVI